MEEPHALHRHADRHATLWLSLTLAIIVGYQMLGVWWGLDLCDSGFYLTFYDNIFTAPETVQYNFMFYLSGVLGGALQWLFPSMGVVGFRLAGVVVNTLAAIVIWLALRRHVPPLALAFGALLVVMTYVKPVYTFCYDLLTALLYVAAIALLYRGLIDSRMRLIAAAGFVAGLNIFMRVPNVLGLAMVAVIIIDHRDSGTTWGTTWRRVAAFAAGVAAGIGVVVATMVAAGHWRLFLAILTDLQEISADTSGTATHSSTELIMTQLRFYGNELWCAAKFAVPIVSYTLLSQRLQRAWLRWALLAVCLAVVAWMALRMPSIQPLWLLCVTGTVWAIVRGKREVRIAAWLGLGMLLVFPLGSDGGAYNNGSIIAWAAAPVAAILWTRQRLLPFTIALLACSAVTAVTGGAYFDGGNLLSKTAVITMPRAADIHTTPERAQAIDSVMSGIASHVHEGDTLLVYGCAPMLNYLSHTRPAMGCSWPELLSADALERRLATLDKCPPLVLRQKFSAMGQQWTTPSEEYLVHYPARNGFQDDRKLQVFNAFLQRHGYAALYDDSHFVLLAPLP